METLLPRVGLVLCTPHPTINRFTKPNKLRSSSSVSGRAGGSLSTTCATSRWAERLIADFQFLGDASSGATATLSPSSVPPRLDPPERYVSIPLDLYRVLGAESHFLGDGIRRAYEAKFSKPPQYAFSNDALVSRRQILQAACETLADPASRREYNQGLVDDEDAAILTQIPFDKVILSV